MTSSWFFFFLSTGSITSWTMYTFRRLITKHYCSTPQIEEHKFSHWKNVVRGFIIWKERVKEVVLWNQKINEASFSDKRFYWHEDIQESRHISLCGYKTLVTYSAEHYIMQKLLYTNTSTNLGGSNGFGADPLMKPVNPWFIRTTECFVINKRKRIF